METAAATQTSPPNRKGRPIRLLYLGLGALVLLLVSAGLLVRFFPDFVDGYVKRRVERAFAKAHTELHLSIGHLEYDRRDGALVASRIGIQSQGTNGVGSIETVSLRGVRWLALLRDRRIDSRGLANAVMEAKGLIWTWPHSEYSLHCDQVRGTRRSGDWIADGLRVRPTASDEAFFAARQFRRTRIELRVPRLSFLALTNSASPGQYRAQAVIFEQPWLETLMNRDKLPNPNPNPPPDPRMVLKRVRARLEIARVEVRGGEIRLGQRADVGTQPEFLTFNDPRIGMEYAPPDSTNRLENLAFNGEAQLMNAATFRLMMRMPTASNELAVRYSGSLSRLDMTRLNPFLMVAGHSRLTAGTLHEARFNFEIHADHAAGQFIAAYEGLDLVMLDKLTGSEKGIKNRVKTFVTDQFIIRRENMPDKSGGLKAGTIDYTRKPGEKFLHFSWFALRSGIVDLLGLGNWVKAPH